MQNIIRIIPLIIGSGDSQVECIEIITRGEGSTDQLSTKFNKSDSSYHSFISTAVIVTTGETVTTKTLPKTMRNNNYQIFISPVSSAFNGVIPSWNISSKTTTAVSIYFKYGGPYDILICEL